MKKVICIVVILVLTLTFLTGCGVSQKEANKLLKAMKKQKIVDENISLIEKVEEISVSLLGSYNEYYIYNNGQDLIAINYKKIDNKDSNYQYKITIYSNVTINNNIEYYEEDSANSHYFRYEDKRKSYQNKYVFNDENKTEYEVYEKNGLFSKKYVFEQTSY